jgi:2-polyprenyl-6-methoxyphenol hydroxylase-like FAD-dependent oxidoreductase
VSRPLKIQILERARELIADEQHWCRHHLGEDVNGVAVSATSAKALKRCGLGAVIAAAYQLTQDYDAAHRLGHEALRPHYSPATLIHVNDIRGHAAVLALFDEVIAAG